MKKLMNLLRFSTISVFMLVFVIGVGHVLFKLFWNFDILNQKSYQILYDYWEKGGVFNTFRDCSLALSLLATPIIWLKLSYKIYKKGFWKSVFSIFDKSYRHLTRPKNMEIEHVSLKNIGGKDKTLDEILTDKIKEQNGSSSTEHMSRDIRKQIAAKIEENEKG